MKMLKAFMGQNSFLMVNKAMIAEVGMEAAIFLSLLVDAYTIFETEWFFQTTPTIEGLSSGFLTRRKQENAIKILIEKGMIEQKNMGLPMRKHFKINEEVVVAVFNK
ncbi:MAG: hypothetical protein ACRCTF_10405 [Bacteroidales bacterium]